MSSSAANQIAVFENASRFLLTEYRSLSNNGSFANTKKLHPRIVSYIKNLTCTWLDGNVISERGKNKNQNHTRRHPIFKTFTSFNILLRVSLSNSWEVLVRQSIFYANEIFHDWRNNFAISEQGTYIGHWITKQKQNGKWCEERKGTFESNRRIIDPSVYRCLSTNMD